MLKSFPMLIHQLAEIHHGSCILQMALATDLAYTTLWRWERGMTRQYDLGLVKQLCEHYDLDDRDVSALIHRDYLRRREGKPIPVPDLSERRRGPAARRGERREV